MPTRKPSPAGPLPSPDDFDYAFIPKNCARHREYAVYVGNAGLACIMNTAGFLRNMEQMFFDLAGDEPAGLLLIDRILAFQLEKTRRELEAAKGEIDFMWAGRRPGHADRSDHLAGHLPQAHRAAAQTIL